MAAFQKSLFGDKTSDSRSFHRPISTQSDPGILNDRHERSLKTKLRRGQTEERLPVTTEQEGRLPITTEQGGDSGIERYTDKDTSSEEGRSTGTPTNLEASVSLKYVSSLNTESHTNSVDTLTKEHQEVKTEPEVEVDMDPETKSGVSKDKAPHFVRYLVDQEIQIGDTVTLSATIEGDPYPDVMWLKDGVEITSDRRHTVDTNQTSGVCSLTIRRCRTFDKGMYECSASNSHGQVESTAKLDGSYSSYA